MGLAIDAMMTRIKAIGTVNRIGRQVTDDLGGDGSEAYRKSTEANQRIIEEAESRFNILSYDDHRGLLDAYKARIGEAYYRDLVACKADILELARSHNWTVAADMRRWIAVEMYRSFKTLAPDSELKESDMIDYCDALYELA
jgi:hypothetical protein